MGILGFLLVAAVVGWLWGKGWFWALVAVMFVAFFIWGLQIEYSGNT